MIPHGLSPELQPIAQETHRLHESALHSAQGQFEQAKLWRALNMILGIPAAVLAAISGGTSLSSPHDGTIPGVLALLAAGLGATLTTVNASRRMTQAQASANAYLALQTAARQFLTIDLPKLSYDESRAELKRLSSQRDELNNTADPPSAYAYWRASRNLRRGGQDYEVDVENRETS
jgi:hypothetical protein